jgi:hypothetical protein
MSTWASSSGVLLVWQRPYHCDNVSVRNSRSSQSGDAAVNSSGEHDPSPHEIQHVCRCSGSGGRRVRPQRQDFDQNPVSSHTVATRLQNIYYEKIKEFNELNSADGEIGSQYKYV